MALPHKLRRLVVHVSPSTPSAVQMPTEIHLWFQRPGGAAYVLCQQGWVAWPRGAAIKEVCDDVHLRVRPMDARP